MAIKYTINEERANFISHSFGVVIILVVSIYFIAYAPVDVTPMYMLGMLLYSIGASSSYIASSVYHHCPAKSPYREKLRKFDHAAIYWHIAGSYSPITLIGMTAREEWGWILFILVWLCAIVGSVISFRGLKEHSNIETICFVGMGLLMLVAFNPVLECIGWKSMKWILAEGAAFIVGAVFYSFNKIAYMHTVFHVFVLFGSVFHILAIYYMLY